MPKTGFLGPITGIPHDAVILSKKHKTMQDVFIVAEQKTCLKYFCQHLIERGGFHNFHPFQIKTKTKSNISRLFVKNFIIHAAIK